MLTSWRLSLSKMFLIPQRYVLGIMGFLAVVNAYTMRISLSVAITKMTFPTTNNITSEDVCTFDSSGESDPVDPNDPNLYHWENEKGLILSSFYWGYVITHLPGGIIAEKFGGKYSLGLGILSTAVFTLLTPWVVDFGDWQGLIILRVLQGLGEGTTYPALNAILSQWVPLGERAKIGTLVYAGGQIGTIVGNMGAGWIIKETGEWAPVFYVFGGLGVAWFILWTLLCYSTPESHPFVSDDERNYIRKELGPLKNARDKVIPWRAILTSAPVWALVAAQIGHDWGFFTMVTDLPIYMNDILKFEVHENGTWSSLPYVLMWIVSMSSGVFCDWLTNRGIMSITFARKFFTTIAAIGPGIFIVGAGYSGCDQVAAVALFTIAMGFMGSFYCGMKVNALDLAPNYAGSLMAIVNGIGAITGIITPYLTDAMTSNHRLSEWQAVFWISFAVFIVTTIIFDVWGSGLEQPWNNEDYMNKTDAEETGEKEKSSAKAKAIES